MRIVLLFPGQGSQSPDIFGKDSLWDSWDEDWAFLKDQVPQELAVLLENLNDTHITQPAIVGYSWRAFELLQPLLAQHSIVALAGHSLGELTATGVALGWGIQLCLTLAHERGVLMQQACNAYPGDLGMQAWLGRLIDKVAVRSLLSKSSDIWLLNDNAPSQVVVGGVLKEFSAEELSLCGVKKIIPLPVSVVSHCPILEPICESWEAILSLAPWGRLKSPLFNHSNVCFTGTAQQAFHNLSTQLTQPVRFEETINVLAQQADLFIEVGPGSVLKNLVKKITPIPCLSVVEVLQGAALENGAIIT